MNLQELQQFLYREYRENGYEEMWQKAGRIGDLAELGKVCEEIGEAMQELSIHSVVSFESFYTECADIIIRTMNLMTRKGCIDIESVIHTKTLKNMKRGELHGKEV